MNKVIRHPTVRLIIAILSLVAIVGIVRSVVTILRKGDMVRERTEALRVEKQRHKELTQRLEEATSSAFIEKVAREKLGLVKEGDIVVLMNTSQRSDFAGQEGQETESLPVWKQWWRLFF